MSNGRNTRSRFAVSAGIAALIVALVGIVVVVSTADPADSPATEPLGTVVPVTTPVSDSGAVPDASSAQNSTPTTVWTPPPDDPTQPSPAAVAAGREFRAAPDDLLDCGVHVRTSGWPTTAVFGPDQVDCILDAAETGTPAQFVTAARDFAGGMEGIVFRVLGPAEILVIRYAADPTGSVTSTESTCAALQAPNFPIPECV